MIGVIDEFRKDGELSTAESYMFQRMRLDDGEPKAAIAGPPFVRLRAGTPPAFEETLVEARDGRCAGDWSFEVQPLDVMRGTSSGNTPSRSASVGTVAGFLLMMVGARADGRRLAERHPAHSRVRARGVPRARLSRNVRMQVLVEMVIMTSIALLVGVFLVAQMPLLPLPSDSG